MSSTPSTLSPASSNAVHEHDDVIYPAALPFIVLHLACLGAIWSGVTVPTIILCLALYVIRMFGVTAGFHRYFSHRAFKTSRAFQFLLAWLAQSSAQRGALWWAAKHRHHHRHSDTPEDIHSPKHHGLYFAHFGWVFTKANEKPTELGSLPDLEKFPELKWLDRYHHVPAIVLAILCTLGWGWPGFFIGFCWSTVLLYHGTFAINSLAHVWGKQRYYTADDSRNNFVLALITMGEGWHNNHHYFMGSARQGFRWYEIDATYWLLRVLKAFHLVWDLQAVPESAYHGERRLSRALVAHAVRDIGAKLPPDADEALIEAKVRATLGNSPSVPDVVSGIQASLADSGRLPEPALLAASG